MKVKTTKYLSAHNLEAKMQTEFGRLVKVTKRVNGNVILETKIMQFDLKANQTVMVYN
jgi:hypothetical protein|tara:strand:+ start:415 stop:588 length:174 start_codon:yes stop_codon:yes gene_type:complete